MSLVKDLRSPDKCSKKKIREGSIGIENSNSGDGRRFSITAATLARTVYLHSLTTAAGPKQNHSDSVICTCPVEHSCHVQDMTVSKWHHAGHPRTGEPLVYTSDHRRQTTALQECWRTCIRTWMNLEAIITVGLQTCYYERVSYDWGWGSLRQRITSLWAKQIFSAAATQRYICRGATPRNRGKEWAFALVLHVWMLLDTQRSYCSGVHREKDVKSEPLYLYTTSECYLTPRWRRMPEGWHSTEDIEVILLSIPQNFCHRECHILPCYL